MITAIFIIVEVFILLKNLLLFKCLTALMLFAGRQAKSLGFRYPVPFL